MYGHSGIMSFYHKGGLEESKKLLQELKLITLAESLGGYESLAELPYLVLLSNYSKIGYRCFYAVHRHYGIL